MPSIYFGNLRKGLYVPAPTSGADAGIVGSSDAQQFSNGGAFVSRSQAGHREFNFGWGVQFKNDLAFLNHFRNGVYGSGLLSFVDPFASNALPPHWANPSLTTRDWPSLISRQVQGVAVATAANAYDMPYESVSYTYNLAIGEVPERTLDLLVPPDMSLSLGFVGSSTTGGVLRVQPVRVDGTLAPTEDLTFLAVNQATRMNKTYSGATYRAVRLYVTTTTVGQSTLTLTSGKAVYGPLTAAPAMTGYHMEGEGHSGLAFEGDPTLVYIQATDDRPPLVTAAAKFTEIGAWL